MKISLITATYNSEKNIKDCLRSIAEQSYHNIEHIIIDGGSQDKTLEIVKASPSVTKYISEPDHGIYDALNKGIKKASGDIIGFLHSDDMLNSKDIVKKIMEEFNSDKNINGIYGNLLFVDSKNTNKIERFWQSAKFKRYKIKNGWMPPHPTLFLKKEVYQKFGQFDISFKIAGDYDFMLRVMNDKKINLSYIPEVITKMRMGGISTGRVSNILTKSKEDMRALKNNGIHFPFSVLAIKNLRKLPQLLAH